MAITESDYLHICKEEVSYLLLRSSTHFYLIKEDATLTGSTYKRLLRIFPCDLQQLENLGVHATAFRAENLHHVIVQGFCAGDKIEFWIGSDLRQYRLAEAYADVFLTDFFDGYPITRKLPPLWTGLHPKLILYITWTMNITSLLCSLAFLFYEEPYWLWSGLCILCQFAPIILIHLFPASFFFDDRKEDYSRIGNRQGNVLPALLAPVFSLALRTIMDFTFTSNAFWPLFLISSFVYSVAFLPMALASRYLKNRLITAVIMIPVMLLGMGTIAQLNYLLDFTSADNHIVMVTDKRSDYGIRATSHYCTVQFTDGKTTELALSASDYKQIDLGEQISVTYYEGIFHIPFYKLGDS